MSVIAFADRADQPAEALDVAGVLRIGAPLDREVLLTFIADAQPIPIGYVAVRSGAVGRNAQHQSLFAFVRGAKSLIENLPMVLPLFRLQKSPVDPEVGDRGHREILGREFPFEVLIDDGIPFRPRLAGVQDVSVNR